MIGPSALMQYIGEFENFNNIHPFQAAETIFFLSDKQTGLSQRVPTPDDNITEISTKQEYAQDLPVIFCSKLNLMDLIYHALSNTDQDRAIFRNLPKLWLRCCIHATDDPDKG